MSDIKKEIIMKNGYIDVHHHIIPDAYREALAEAVSYTHLENLLSHVRKIRGFLEIAVVKKKSA